MAWSSFGVWTHPSVQVGKSANQKSPPSRRFCGILKNKFSIWGSGHSMDVYDLCWSPDSIHLCSASIDNNIIIWDVTRGMAIIKHDNFVDKSILQTISEHTQFIQVFYDSEQFEATRASRGTLWTVLLWAAAMIAPFVSIWLQICNLSLQNLIRMV